MCHHILESAALYAWMSSVSDDESVILVDAPVDPSKHLLLYPVEYHQVGRFLDIRLKENDCTIYNTGHVLRLPIIHGKIRRSTRARGVWYYTESPITRSTRPAVTPSVCNPKPQELISSSRNNEEKNKKGRQHFSTTTPKEKPIHRNDSPSL
jgi:hypothetical protein